ncbi:MAG: addiction module protein [Betaproteobacteria bacterium]|nr:addiction module protein [Betaproteobacteria bacterium]
MSVLLHHLEQQARTLPADERARLVEVLLDSLRETEIAEIEAEWEREIAERVAAYERGEAETFSAEELFAEARRLAK